MTAQPRVVKVLALLLVSMTGGAIILMALGHNPPSAGPFSLWTYYRLDSVKNIIRSEAVQSSDRWSRIEIFYSGTKTGSIEKLASFIGLTNSRELNLHFVVCNGHGGTDGQIQKTEKWQKQWPAISGRTSQGSGQTIRICVIADDKISRPTDCQIKRVQVLVESLCKRFHIQREYILYPDDRR